LVSACILICCEAGKYASVAEKVKGIKGVKRAFPACSRWDVIAHVEAADLKALTNTALEINKLSGVRATETLVEATL